MLKWRRDANTPIATKTPTGDDFHSSMAAFEPDVAEVSSASQRSSSHSLSSANSSTRDDATSGTRRDSSSLCTLSSSEVNFQWSDQEEPVSAFANDDNKLPCVARLELANPLPPGLRPYGGHPLLLFKSLKRRQARARTIYHDKAGAYYEVGQTILIPDDYTGWFELVPPDFSRASCCRSIGEVASAMPRKFFTRSNIKALRVEQGKNGEQTFIERKVQAGSFLKTVNIFTAKWKTTAQTGVFKKKQKEFVTQEVKYLKCLDTDEKEIMISLSHTGKFNAIYEKGRPNQHSVYTMKDILSDLKLPIKVRLLFGKAPVVPCIFTGMLCVRHVQNGDVILASTFLNRRNVLLQIPVTVETDDENAHTWKERDPLCPREMALRQTARDEDFSQLPGFADATKLCRKYAVMFSTLMKLAPEQDTAQRVIQHVPSCPDPRRRGGGASGQLRALDLITDIRLTGGGDDDAEPADMFVGETDTDSVQGDDAGEQGHVVPAAGSFVEFTLFAGGASDTRA